MNSANLSLWVAGLALQAILLVVLFRRRLLRRVPVFSLLIAFYLVRAGLLYGLFSHMASDDYGHLYSGLSVVDLCLQILVAVEIAVQVVREIHAIRAGRRLRTAALFAIAIGVAATLAAFFPNRGRVPLDRGIVFTTLLFLFLLVWMVMARVSGLPRRIAEGFVTYGVIATLAGIGRNVAILHRSKAGFAAASYAESGIYICVVIFWIFTLRPRRQPKKLA